MAFICISCNLLLTVGLQNRAIFSPLSLSVQTSYLYACPLCVTFVPQYLHPITRLADMMGVTGLAFAVLFLAFAVAFAAAATCPHEDGSFENWSDSSTWDNGKV